MAGAAALAEGFGTLVWIRAQVRVVRAPCMGRCDTAPVLELGHHHIDHATPEKGFGRNRRGPYPCRYSLTMKGLRPIKLRAATLAYWSCAPEGDWQEVQAQIKASGLRGLGGAGFPVWH